MFDLALGRVTQHRVLLGSAGSLWLCIPVMLDDSGLNMQRGRLIRPSEEGEAPRIA